MHVFKIGSTVFAFSNSDVALYVLWAVIVLLMAAAALIAPFIGPKG